MRFGSFVTITPWAPMGLNQPGVSSALAPLYGIALQWLKEDREFRQELEKQGQKMRGARRNEVNMSQLWREFILTWIFTFSLSLPTQRRSTKSK